MAGMIRLLFPLVGYLCVASTITAAGGYGYLRYSGILDDEKLFRIVSILHDIDLQEVTDREKADQEEVPPEEMSYEQRQEHLQMATLHLQAKKDDLEKQLNEFQTQFRQLNIANARYQAYKEDVEKYLQQRKKEAQEEGLLAVRKQLQNLAPKRQAKPLLVKMIKDDRADEVITLLNGMPTKKRSDILKTFDTVEDIDMLYRIQEKMLSGDPVKPFIDEKLKELNQMKELEN